MFTELEQAKLMNNTSLAYNIYTLLCAVKFHKMKIKAKVELSKVEQWNTDWNNESEKANELKKLEWDMKMAIYERCGVDLSNISIELEVSD